MASIATFYLLPETQRAEFLAAHRDQKTVTYRRSLFGKKEVVKGERYLWEYLDAEAGKRREFPFSGFVLIDYFYTFVSLPPELDAELESTGVDENYTAISAGLAASLGQFLEAHPAEPAALAAFAEEEGREPSPEYVQALRETHDFLLDWFRHIAPGKFGVLHLTF